MEGIRPRRRSGDHLDAPSSELPVLVSRILPTRQLLGMLLVNRHDILRLNATTTKLQRLGLPVQPSTALKGAFIAIATESRVALRRIVSFEGGTSVDIEGSGTYGNVELQHVLNGLPTDEQWSKAEAELAERMLEGSVRIVTACELRYTITRLVLLQRCHNLLKHHRCHQSHPNHHHCHEVQQQNPYHNQQQQHSPSPSVSVACGSGRLDAEAEAEQNLLEALYDTLTGYLWHDDEWARLRQWLQCWSAKAAVELIQRAVEAARQLQAEVAEEERRREVEVDAEPEAVRLAQQPVPAVVEAEEVALLQGSGDTCPGMPQPQQSGDPVAAAMAVLQVAASPTSPLPLQSKHHQHRVPRHLVDNEIILGADVVSTSRPTITATLHCTGPPLPPPLPMWPLLPSLPIAPTTTASAADPDAQVPPPGAPSLPTTLQHPHTQLWLQAAEAMPSHLKPRPRQPDITDPQAIVGGSSVTGAVSAMLTEPDTELTPTAAPVAADVPLPAPFPSASAAEREWLLRLFEGQLTVGEVAPPSNTAAIMGPGLSAAEAATTTSATATYPHPVPPPWMRCASSEGHLPPGIQSSAPMPFASSSFEPLSMRSAFLALPPQVCQSAELAWRSCAATAAQHPPLEAVAGDGPRQESSRSCDLQPTGAQSDPAHPYPAFPGAPAAATETSPAHRLWRVVLDGGLRCSPLDAELRAVAATTAEATPTTTTITAFGPLVATTACVSPNESAAFQQYPYQYPPYPWVWMQRTSGQKRASAEVEKVNVVAEEPPKVAGNGSSAKKGKGPGAAAAADVACQVQHTVLAAAAAAVPGGNPFAVAGCPPHPPFSGPLAHQLSDSPKAPNSGETSAAPAANPPANTFPAGAAGIQTSIKAAAASDTWDSGGWGGCDDLVAVEQCVGGGVTPVANVAVGGVVWEGRVDVVRVKREKGQPGQGGKAGGPLRSARGVRPCPSWPQMILKKTHNWAKQVRRFLSRQPGGRAKYSEMVRAGIQVPPFLVRPGDHQGLCRYLSQLHFRPLFKVACILKRISGDVCVLQLSTPLPFNTAPCTGKVGSGADHRRRRDTATTFNSVDTDRGVSGSGNTASHLRIPRHLLKGEVGHRWLRGRWEHFHIEGYPARVFAKPEKRLGGSGGV